MKKLAILGASYLQVPLIVKAKELGIETHVFAWEDGAVGKELADYFYPISILNTNEIYNICKKIFINTKSNYLNLIENNPSIKHIIQEVSILDFQYIENLGQQYSIDPKILDEIYQLYYQLH